MFDKDAIFNNDDDLATLWGDTPAEELKYVEVPDGKYEATVNTVRFENSKAGKPMIKWDLIIKNNGQEGRHVFLNQMITDQKQVGFVKGQLQSIGLNVSSLQSIKEDLAELLDATLAITLKTRPATAEYEARQNVYLNMIIERKQNNLSNVFADDDLPF